MVMAKLRWPWMKRKYNGRIQTCSQGHEFIANSHEYPCPYCQIISKSSALSEIREIVTTCVPYDIEGKLLEICKTVLLRSLNGGVEYLKPKSFRSNWEQEVYATAEKHKIEFKRG